MSELSIIVPIYNVEEYLRNCIESILNQSFKNFELILVNDGSTDNSLNICREYEKNDKRIRVIDKKNGGVSSARNVGIDIAKGKYIAFVDPDDDIDFNMYEELIKTIKSLNVDIVISSFKYVDVINKKVITQKVWNEINKVIKKKEIHKILMEILSFKENYGLLSSFNKLYARKLFSDNNIRFDENKNHGEDVRLNLLLLMKVERICFLETPFYNYYIRDRESLTKIYKKDLYNYILDNRNFHQYMCEELKCNELITIGNIHYLNETIKYMVQTIRTDIALQEKRSIINEIMYDNTFINFIETYREPYKYYEILKKICIKRKPILFIIAVKVLIYKEKWNKVINRIRRIE